MKAEWLFEVAPHFFNPDNIKDVDTKRELMKIERELVERKKKEAELEAKLEKKREKKEKKEKKKKRFVFS